MADAFSEFGPWEESLFGKIPIWDAITVGKTFAKVTVSDPQEDAE
jgi:hypothetical protein